MRPPTAPRKYRADAQPLALARPALLLLLSVIACGEQPPSVEPVDKTTTVASSTASTAATAASTPQPKLPGISSGDPALMAELAAGLKEKGPDYRPRTHHLHPDGSPRFTNRLILTGSPYLLQHAHNPVNWYPWGDEAFARARAENKPIFVSIGYSTCHWCHVMERESFEDEEIAAYLNTHFVAVKVDREQRPDIDDLYMGAVQMLTGRGGWPMTVVMTPDRDPFFGGTYFPPRDGARGARKGLLSILKTLVAEFTEDAGGVVSRAQRLSQRLQAASAPPAPGDIPGAAPIHAVARQSAKRYDPTWGGFGRAPKFPRPALPSLLLRYHRRTGDAESLQQVVRTLSAMLTGGIYDQVGGGFHRYTTDTRWLVPHFEKMLYDNAQLTCLLLDAYQLTGRADFRRVARETLDYVHREMTAPGGGFYSATDADSPVPGGHEPGPGGREEEGYFFTWTPAELEAVLGKDDAAIVGDYFGVTARGNFEGRNILTRWKDAAEVAKRHGMNATALSQRIDAAIPKLRAAREKRPPPHLDDKVLAAWNGLMISAFARGGLVLGDPALTAHARAAADFILEHMKDAEGRLLRSYRGGHGQQGKPGGRASHLAYLDDHAFLIAGLLDLLEASAEPRYLQAALQLQAQLDARFWDGENGGYFMGGTGHERLIAQDRPSYDGAEPAGNSIALMNLLRLAEITGDDAHRKRADRALSAFARDLSRHPGGSPAMLAALERYLDRPREVFILTPTPATATSDTGADAATEALLEQVRTSYLPNRFLLTVRGPTALQSLARHIPGLKGKQPLNGRPTAFVCERGRCQLPTSRPKVLAKQLSQVTPLPE